MLWHQKLNEGNGCIAYAFSFMIAKYLGGTMALSLLGSRLDKSNGNWYCTLQSNSVTPLGPFLIANGRTTSAIHEFVNQFHLRLAREDDFNRGDRGPKHDVATITFAPLSPPLINSSVLILQRIQQGIQRGI